MPYAASRAQALTLPMSRRIAAAEFVTSAVAPRDFPVDARPEVALVGRSNVGKSSLINALVRRPIARTSASPGKTRQVNVYRITPAGASPFYLMDLPGYGHAGGGDKARQEFSALTASYFETRTGRRSGPGGATPAPPPRPSALCAVVLMIDARHPGMASDIDAVNWFHGLGLPYLLVATKVDKLSQSEKAKLKGACLEAFGVAPLTTSAIDGNGLDELWKRIAEWTA
jgi:GTP-binding protein